MIKQALKTLVLGGALITATSTMALADHHGDMKGKMDKEHHGGGKMMQHLDTDGDGKVTEAEFLAKSKERFAKMDSNGDGVIDQADIDAMKAKGMEKRKGPKSDNAPQDDDMMMDDGMAQ